MRFLEDGNKDRLKGDYINILKLEKMGKLLSDLISTQRNRYQYQPVPELMALLGCLPLTTRRTRR
jgi:hypothetical protein